MESRATRPAGRLLVHHSASPTRAPRPASTASHRPWMVQSPYCSGSCPWASAWAPPEGDVAARPVAPVGDWWDCWLAGQTGRPGAPLSLGGGPLLACRRAPRGTWRLHGKSRDNDQGPRGAWTRRRIWRGSRPWGPACAAAPRGKPPAAFTVVEGEGGGACLLAFRRGSGAGVALWCLIPSSRLRGGWLSACPRLPSARRAPGGGAG